MAEIPRTFIPCETCKQDPRALVNTTESWIYLCAKCRASRNRINRINEVRKGVDPIAGAFNVRMGLNFDIEGLKERLTSMFFIREADFTDKISKVIDEALTDENIEKRIKAEVEKEIADEMRREVGHRIRSEINKRLGTEDVRRKIEDEVKSELIRHGLRSDT